MRQPGDGIRIPLELSSAVKERVRRLIARVPRVVWLGIVLALAVAAFAGIFLPLFQGGGPAVGEVDGTLPHDALVGQPTVIEVAIDNTGTSPIEPVCIGVSTEATVELRDVVFQGLDRVRFSGSRACGGTLSGQETMNVRITVVPRSAGNLHLSVSASSGERAIGPPLQGVISVH